ncbi:hypothetical protein M427DRAFT_50721 [Gonapodya prolifera JEL478]|uniref:Hydantoin racemase n=1 Tax=Gonapodya prolifera (strain JEL478) TaxID=1344416 RepID=A0A139B0C3_GONPJ|nr:hypothetical protein M427DRAFT_50721 [Gonapodya prolifera JEL478]|eukprot:KXS22390.1 hypothetical protein M427DRAFT_50721 [Gonapodya prolifera JEL478]
MRSILIINPNSSNAMTEALKPLVDRLANDGTSFSYFTAPSGPASINNDADAASSVDHCLPALRPLLKSSDAFLVACYSAHPLVPTLAREPEVIRGHKPVMGILEASVIASLLLVNQGERFGIVSTGKVWEELLAAGVAEFLGSPSSARFAGVETTGLNAGELHDAPAELVQSRMKEATRRLLARGNIGAICLGCAGMAGLGELVREACVEVLGDELGARMKIVDGVQAGAVQLDATLRMGR